MDLYLMVQDVYTPRRLEIQEKPLENLWEIPTLMATVFQMEL